MTARSRSPGSSDVSHAARATLVQAAAGRWQWPKALLAGGATEFERGLLVAVASERPSPALKARMWRALERARGPAPRLVSKALPGPSQPRRPLEPSTDSGDTPREP